MRYTHAGALVLSVSVVLWSHSARAAGQVTPPPAPGATVESLPVPEWLAWRVFHESLAFYRTRSAPEVEQMLAVQAGLAPKDSAALLKAGDAFVSALQEIDTAARAELHARYGRPRDEPTGAVATARPAGPPPPGGMIRHAPGKTVLDMVRESGLYDQVERQKRVALAAHITQVEQAIGAVLLARVTQLVQTAVVPTIRRGMLPPPAPPATLPSGAVRTPPPGASIRPGDAP
jgi:hypothetical protein